VDACEYTSIEMQWPNISWDCQLEKQQEVTSTPVPTLPPPKYNIVCAPR